MEMQIVENEQKATIYFMDWCGWSYLILLDNKVIFSCNRYAHDIVLDYVSREVIDDWINKWYLLGKCRERWATKKDCDFIWQMIDHFIKMKNLWKIIKK